MNEHVIWGKCASNQLEAKGFKLILDGPIKQLVASKKFIRLVLDGDLKLRKLARDLKNIELYWDLAHLKTNAIKAIAQLIKDCKFMGDALDRIGKKNFLAFTRAIQTAMKEAVQAVKEDSATADKVIAIMNEPIDHFAGKF